MNHEAVQSMGYMHPKMRADGSWCGILKLIFTYALVSDINRTGYGDRWCYKSEEAARLALDEWADSQEEPKGWHRHPASGRRIDQQGRVTINY